MRLASITLTILIFMAGMAAAGHSVDIGVTVDGTQIGVDDTIWAGEEASFDFYFENDDTLGGYSTGFKIWSDDGAAWTWDTAIFDIVYIPPTMPPEFDTLWEMITAVTGSRQYPQSTVWDNGGLQITIADTISAETPIRIDSILFGGTRKNHGLYPGALERQILAHFTAGGVEYDFVRTICIDSAKIGPAGEFVFSDITGATFSPVTLWPEGGRCWPVKIEGGQPAPATISLSPAEITRSGEVGAPVAPETVSVTNIGGGVLSWSATKILGSTWLNISPTGGTGDGTIDVTFNIGSLGAGTFKDTIQVSDPSATNSPQKVPVTLTLIPAAVDDTVYVGSVTVIAGEEAVIDINYANYEEMNVFDLTVSFVNTGVTCDSVSFVGSRVGGFASLTSTVDNDNDYIIISGDASGEPKLAEGSGLLAKLYFSTDMAAPTQAVSVDSLASANSTNFGFFNDAEQRPLHYIVGNLNIEAVQPRLHLSQTEFDFGNRCKGELLPFSFEITNDSTGILDWTATADPEITILSATSGTAPSTMNGEVNTAGLTGGQIYTLTITINATGALNQPQDVTIIFNLIDCEECTFDIAEVDGHQGLPVAVPVYNYGSHEIGGLQFYFEYDNSILQYDSVASAYMDGPTIGAMGNQINYIWDDIASPFTVPGATPIMTLWFTTIGTVGEVSPVTWSETYPSEIYTAVGDLILGVGFCDGSVTVVPPVYDVTGKIVYYDLLRDVADIQVDLSGDAAATVFTDEHGDYYFEDIMAGSYTATPSRAADDPGVSVADAIKIRRHLALIEVLDSPYKMVAGDVNADNKVSVGDVIKIRLYLAKLETTFGAGNWAFIDSDFAITMANWFDSPRYIDFTVVDVNLTLQDFVAVRIGDVNNTWLPPAKSTFAKLGPGAEINLPDIYGKAGDMITLPIEISDAPELAGLEVHIGYDPEQLKVIGISSDLLTNMTTNTAEGQIHLVWEDYLDPVSATDGQAVAIIKMQISERFNSSAEFSINKAEIADARGEIYPLELSGGVLIEGSNHNTLPAAYSLEQNSPNPFNPYTTIRATMKEAGEYSLTIYNIVGEKVRQFTGYHEAGLVELVWDGRDDNGITMASGIFLYQFKAADFSATKKMMLIK